MAKSKKRIDPDKWYGLLDIVELAMFPWAKTVKSVRGWVQRDKDGRDVLKATIVGSGRQTRYLIKGKNLIQFIASIEAGDYM